MTIAARYPSISEIRGIYIDEAGLRALGRVHGSELTVVEFHDPYTHDCGVEGLCRGSPNLKKLRLRNQGGTIVTNASVKAIETYCPNIEVLSLNYWDEITDECIQYLLQLKSLIEINMSNCNTLTSTGVQRLLRGNNNMQVLIFSNIFDDEDRKPTPFINAKLLTCISTHCPHLTTLHLAVPTGSDVTSASLSAMIRGCPLLQDLRLDSYNKHNYTLPTLASYCLHLRRLYIDKVLITDEDVTVLCQGCKVLVSLALRNCETITDKGIISIATYCQQLQDFTISYNNYITDTSLCTLFINCIDLRTVHLQVITLITDRSIFTLVQHCLKLHSLSLLYNTYITDRSVMTIALYGKHIEHLGLYHIADASDESIILITKHCKNLSCIDFEYLPSITTHCITAILDKCKHLTEFRVACDDVVDWPPRFQDACDKRCMRYKGPKIQWF